MGNVSIGGRQENVCIGPIVVPTYGECVSFRTKGCCPFGTGVVDSVNHDRLQTGKPVLNRQYRQPTKQVAFVAVTYLTSVTLSFPIQQGMGPFIVPFGIHPQRNGMKYAVHTDQRIFQS